MTTTASQINRTKVDYSLIAGEPIDIQVIGGALYAFGSELATLRLFRKMPTKRQGFSENLGKHYFSVELSN